MKRERAANEERCRKSEADMDRRLYSERVAFDDNLKVLKKQNKEQVEEQMSRFQSEINDLRRENENIARKKLSDDKEISRLESLIDTERRKSQRDFERQVERKIVDHSNKNEYVNHSSSASGLGAGRSRKLDHELYMLNKFAHEIDYNEDENLYDEHHAKSPVRSYHEHTARGHDRYNDDYESKSRGKYLLGKIPMLPKSIRFTGESESSWPAFVAKYDLFAKVHKLTKEEKLNNFCWSLEGKASVYYALVTKRSPNLDIEELYDLFETRFDFKDLEETALLRFQSAFQGASEPLEEWADRILQLADKAFKQYSANHMTKQACMRFCQGVFDKKAAQYASNLRPVTMKSALEKNEIFPI